MLKSTIQLKVLSPPKTQTLPQTQKNISRTNPASLTQQI